MEDGSVPKDDAQNFSLASLFAAAMRAASPIGGTVEASGQKTIGIGKYLGPMILETKYVA